jgi:anti-anti-sigma factor
MTPSIPGLFDVRVDPEGALVLRGELCFGSVQDLQDKLDQVLVHDRPIVLDLAQLTFIDSTGIHCIVKTSSASGHPVRLRNTRPAVRRTLDMLDPSRDHQEWVFDGESSTAADRSPSTVSG